MTDLPHPSWNQLVDFAEGRLTTPRTAQLSAHISDCVRCRPQVAWLRGTMKGFSEDGFRAPPRDVREAVMAAWDRRYGSDTTTAVRPVVVPSAMPRRFARPPLGWSVAALAAVLVLALLFLWRSQPQAIIAAVQDVRGGVEITQVGSAPQPAANAQTLAAGDQVATRDDGQARLEFGNGAVVVTVLPSSEVRIEQISLDGQTLERIVVRLLRGEVETTVNNTGTATLLASDATLTSHNGTFQARLLEEGAVAVEAISGQLMAGNAAGSVSLDSGESLILYPGTAPGILPSSPAIAPSQTPTVTNTATAQATQTSTSAATVTRAPTETHEATRITGPSTTVPVLTPAGEFTGRIESVPAGRIGQWRVSGRTFISTASTELKEENGTLAVGACGEVEFVDGSRAIEITTKEAGQCDEREEDEEDEDNSGSGSDDGGSDDGGGDDSSGPSNDDGGADDPSGDESSDDNSGPGNGSDDGPATDDNNGPGSSNDNSGPGSSSDDGGEDDGSDNDNPADHNSSSSGGDDGDGDNSGSGSDSGNDNSEGNQGDGDGGGDNSGSGDDNSGGNDDSGDGDESGNSGGDEDNSGSGGDDEEGGDDNDEDDGN